MLSLIKSSLLVLCTFVLVFGLLHFLDPSFLGEPIHQLRLRLTHSAPMDGGGGELGTDEVSRAFLQQLGLPLSEYNVHSISIGQRPARWDRDPEDLVTLFEFSEKLPLEGPIYTSDPNLVVSGGFMQFLASLQPVAPAPHAAVSSRTAQRLANQRLRELETASQRAKLGASFGDPKAMRQWATATESAVQASIRYGKALGGSPKAATIGMTVLSYFNPAEQMYISRSGLPERVPKVETNPTLDNFLKAAESGIAIPARPLRVEVTCNNEPQVRSQVLNVHVGAAAAQVLWFKRGKWFSEDILHDYRSGFWSIEAPPSPEAYFFGSKGRLRDIPVGLLVARNPFVLLDTPADLEKDIRAGTCSLKMALSSSGGLQMDAKAVSAQEKDRIVPTTGIRFDLADAATPWVLAVLSQNP